MVMVSQDQVDIFAKNSTSEFLDVFKSTERPVTQMEQDVVLTNHAVDVVNYGIVHVVQRFEIPCASHIYMENTISIGLTPI
jgi:hypothetical protein